MQSDHGLGTEGVYLVNWGFDKLGGLSREENWEFDWYKGTCDHCMGDSC